MNGWATPLRRFLTSSFGLLVASGEAFTRDRARRLSAGLAYYAIFALIPSLFTSIFIAAAFVGQEAAAGGLVDGLDDFLGPDAAGELEEAIATVWEATDASQFAWISFGVVVYSASVLFVAWRDALELIWGVPYTSSLRLTIVRRVKGIVAPIGAGLLLASVLILQTVVGVLEGLVRSEVVNATLRVAGTMLPTLAAVLALGLLYRYSTRAMRPHWRAVWLGSAVAAFGLAVAAWGYGMYLRFVGTTSVAGAASSVVVGLVVVYYGAQILLFGAEVVQCSGRRLSSSSDELDPEAGPLHPHL